MPKEIAHLLIEVVEGPTQGLGSFLQRGIRNQVKDWYFCSFHIDMSQCLRSSALRSHRAVMDDGAVMLEVRVNGLNPAEAANARCHWALAWGHHSCQRKSRTGVAASHTNWMMEGWSAFVAAVTGYWVWTSGWSTGTTTTLGRCGGAVVRGQRNRSSNQAIVSNSLRDPRHGPREAEDDL